MKSAGAVFKRKYLSFRAAFEGRLLQRHRKNLQIDLRYFFQVQ